ncbi:nucleoside phosphorylase [Arcticibacter tournemirensis]|uniref:5'-methylthioadenosine/S-adenosylhomocysteine nucleosidase family protein n=1 Tax=Arcticibacter tournemirensis TaxID=699437 RepID=UPI00116FB9DB|nr:hypothetical protein [Arcticibacter tournemirensis]TQM50633.1 nucleoside phosphorylase [Arcticibacter tournemirensis]
MSAKYKEIAPSLIDEYGRYCSILIVTATKIEKDVVHEYLFPIDGQDKILKIQKNSYTYYLGKFGYYNAVHVATGNMGSISRNAAIKTTMKAIEFWKPKVVLMVGIAFGGKPEKVRIGDVLISECVVNYQLIRVNEDGSHTYRGQEGPASSLLLNRFVSADDWRFNVKFDDQDYEAKHVHGLILSGEELVDNKDRKKELMTEWPDAIGGEMEGAGIYTACDGNSVSGWILVKGVCDYGDGDKGKNPNKDLFQEIAVRSSVNLAEHVFSSPYAFEEIGLYSGAFPYPKEESEDSKKKINDALEEQVKRQLAKQKTSQKYIPETFIEVNKNKESLRYFCDPFAFIPKVMWEYSVLNFVPLNKLLAKKGAAAFDFDLQGFEKDAQLVQIESIPHFCARLDNYLKVKISELEHPPVASNSLRDFSYKLSHLEETFQWLAKKVCLIKEDAGQGKTNFVCDLAENFLIKRKVPSVFLLGTDIDPSDIRKSLLNRVYPDRSDLNFETFLSELEQYCRSVNRPFVIIIDGLNENAAAQKLSENLEKFIAEITERTYIKVIITCRSEYYQKHFSNFDKSSFSPQMCETDRLTIGRDKVASHKIFNGYLAFFNINLRTYSTKVFEQLTQNYLLLRIFCDAHRGESIPYLGHIHKESLFRQYFDTKVTEITKRMEGDDELKVSGPINIRNFIGRLIAYMVENRKYENIPLDGLLEKDDNRKVYIRFLDENILVRRDPTGSKGIFGDQEVVNFTFDEFRDYLLSEYLISLVYPKDKKTFLLFLKEEINPSSRILEGCGTFLYYITKKSGNADLLKIVEGQVWFDSIYLRCIFNLEDKYITPTDRDKIFAIIGTNRQSAIFIFFAFRYRYRPTEAPNLNLQHYLEHLRGLSPEEFYSKFLELFTNREFLNDQINIDSFLADTESFLDHYDDGDSEDSDDAIVIDSEKDFPHSLFEILIYLFPYRSSLEISQLYERYYHRFPVQAKAQLKIARGSRNLESSIKKICRRYDILL